MFLAIVSAKRLKVRGTLELILHNLSTPRVICEVRLTVVTEA
jgi:hypothetical protein